MSRALDNDVKKLLMKDDHGKIFFRISEALAQRCSQLLEVELLGRSHPLSDNNYFMQDENAIAIPKLRLVQAFVYALQQLKRYQQNPEASSPDEILRATGVMLLMDPEHLTAANARKRIILQDADSGRQRLLSQDKYYIDSLLTSRLHRHTKSPTLWGHREWLINQCEKDGVEVDFKQDFINVVLVSAERHPRNYYAWSHARFMAKKLGSNGVQDLISLTKQWCFKHHDDISGWAFLSVLLQGRPEETEAVLQQTLQFVSSFQWRNESVWHFLKCVRPSEAAKETSEYRQKLHIIKQNLMDDEDKQEKSFANTVIDRTESWMDVYWKVQ